MMINGLLPGDVEGVEEGMSSSVSEESVIGVQGERPQGLRVAAFFSGAPLKSRNNSRRPLHSGGY
jgi:hypothetical protein